MGNLNIYIYPISKYAFFCVYVHRDGHVRGAGLGMRGVLVMNLVFVIPNFCRILSQVRSYLTKEDLGTSNPSVSSALS